MALSPGGRASRERALPGRWAAAMRVPSAELSDVDVLAAVERLSLAYRSPSTSLIVWELAQDQAVGGAFQAAVRNALERLLDGGEIVCVSHRGTRRWHVGPAGPG